MHDASNNNYTKAMVMTYGFVFPAQKFILEVLITMRRSMIFVAVLLAMFVPCDLCGTEGNPVLLAQTDMGWGMVGDFSLEWPISGNSNSQEFRIGVDYGIGLWASKSSINPSSFDEQSFGVIYQLLASRFLDGDRDLDEGKTGVYFQAIDDSGEPALNCYIPVWVDSNAGDDDELRFIRSKFHNIPVQGYFHGNYVHILRFGFKKEPILQYDKIYGRATWDKSLPGKYSVRAFSIMEGQLLWQQDFGDHLVTGDLTIDRGLESGLDINGKPYETYGKTMAMSIHAADAGGVKSLTFDWSATGPAPVDFVSNGGVGAGGGTKVMANFVAAGDYQVSVTVTNAQGVKAMTAGTVHVRQRPFMGIHPYAADSVSQQVPREFYVSLVDQFGAAMDVGLLHWNVQYGIVDIPIPGGITYKNYPGQASIAVDPQRPERVVITGLALGDVRLSCRVDAPGKYFGIAVVRDIHVVPPPTIPRMERTMEEDGLFAKQAVISLDAKTYRGGLGPEGAGGPFTVSWTATPIESMDVPYGRPPAPRLLDKTSNVTTGLATAVFRFYRFGNYRVTAKIRDDVGAVCARDLVVEVRSRPSQVVVSPATWTMSLGAGKNLNEVAVKVVDQFGLDLAAFRRGLPAPFNDPVGSVFNWSLAGTTDSLQGGLVLDGARQVQAAWPGRRQILVTPVDNPANIHGSAEVTVASPAVPVPTLHVVPVQDGVLADWSVMPQAAQPWGADPDAAMFSQFVVQVASPSGEVVKKVTIPDGRTRSVKITGLDAGTSYTFTLTSAGPVWNGVDAPRTVVSATRTSIGRALDVNAPWDVTGFVAFAKETRVFMRWRYDDAQANEADPVLQAKPIGFLIHRSVVNDGTQPEQLLAALPISPSAVAGVHSYAWTDLAAVPGTTYRYRIQVVDQANRRSGGSRQYGQFFTIAVPGPDAANPNQAIGWSSFQVDQAQGISDLSTGPKDRGWTGSSLGTAFGYRQSPDVKPDGVTIAVDAQGAAVAVVPTRSAALSQAQMFQREIPANQRWTARWRTQVQGMDGATSSRVALLQYLDVPPIIDAAGSRVLPSTVQEVVLTPSALIIGRQWARFYHGNLAHDYVLAKNLDQITLLVDGHPLALQSCELTGSPSAQEHAESSAAVPFLRWGAGATNGSLAVGWWNLAVAHGAGDWLPTVTPLPQDEVATVTSLRATAGAGYGDLTWNTSPNPLITAYRIHVQEDPTFELVVPVGSQELGGQPRSVVTVHIPRVIPATYHAAVQAVRMDGQSSPWSTWVEMQVTSEVVENAAGTRIDATHPVTGETPWTVVPCGGLPSTTMAGPTAGSWWDLRAQPGQDLLVWNAPTLPNNRAPLRKWSAELVFALQDPGKVTLMKVGAFTDDVQPMAGTTPLLVEASPFGLKFLVGGEIIGGAVQRWYPGYLPHRLRLVGYPSGDPQSSTMLVDVWLDGRPLANGLVWNAAQDQTPGRTLLTGVRLGSLPDAPSANLFRPWSLKSVVVVMGATGSDGMETLVYSQDPVRVPEMKDVRASISGTAATLSWSSRLPVGSVNDPTVALAVKFQGPDQDGLRSAQLANVDPDHPGDDPLIFTARFQAGQVVSFKTSLTNLELSDPLPTAVSLVPVAASGEHGFGTVLPVGIANPAGQTPELAQVSDRNLGPDASSWSFIPDPMTGIGASALPASQLVSSGSLSTDPAFALPGVGLRIGDVANLVGSVLPTRAFHRVVGANFGWSAYVDPGVFDGCIAAVATPGSARIEVWLESSNLTIYERLADGTKKALSPIVSSDYRASFTVARQGDHRLMMECQAATEASATPRMSIWLDADPLPMVVAMGPTTNQTELWFGQISHAGNPVVTQAMPCPVVWRAVETRVGSRSAPVQFHSTANQAGPLNGWSSAFPAAESIPAVLAMPERAFLHIPPGQGMVLRRGALTTAYWTLQARFRARGSGQKILGVVTDKPPYAGQPAQWVSALDGSEHVIRLVKTPARLLAYCDGHPWPAGVVDWSVEQDGLAGTAPPKCPDNSTVYFQNGDLIGPVILLRGTMDGAAPGLQPVGYEQVTALRTSVVDAGLYDDPSQFAYVLLSSCLTAGRNLTWYTDVRKSDQGAIEYRSPVSPSQEPSVRVRFPGAGTYGIRATTLDDEGAIRYLAGATVVTPAGTVRGYEAPVTGLQVTPGYQQILLSWKQPSSTGDPTMDSYTITVTDPKAANQSSLLVKNLPADAVCPVPVAIPALLAGTTLNLTIQAKFRDGRVTQPSSIPFSALDTRSVDLIPGTVAVDAGDRRADVTFPTDAKQGVVHDPVDLLGYAIWLNQPTTTGPPLPDKSQPVRILAKLGDGLLPALRALQARELPALTDGQRTQFRALIPSGVAGQRSDNSTIVFYHPDVTFRPRLPLALSTTKNQLPGQTPAQVTLDPFDDGVPTTASQPIPNLGSQESGSGTLPAASSNTMSLVAMTANKAPGIADPKAPSRLLDAAGQEIIRVKDLLSMDAPIGQGIPSWIHNVDVNPEFYLLRGADRTNPVSIIAKSVSDRTLKSVDILVNGVAVRTWTRTIYRSNADDPGRSDPFTYDPRTRTLRLDSVRADLAQGAPFAIGQNLVTLRATDEDGAQLSEDQFPVLVDDQSPTLSILTPAANAIVSAPILIAGAYNENSGIAAMEVRVSGTRDQFPTAPLTISAGKASVQNGTFSVRLDEADLLPAMGGAENAPIWVQVALTDLVGNQAVPAVIPLIVSRGSIQAHADLRLQDKHLLANVRMSGVSSAAGSLPVLTRLTANGVNIPTEAWSTDLALHQVTVTNFDLGDVRDLDVIFKAWVEFSTGTGSVTRTFTCAASYRDPHQPPKILAVRPSLFEPLAPASLYPGEYSRIALTGFGVDYQLTTAGMPTVRLEVPGLTGWVEVTEQVAITERGITVLPDVQTSADAAMSPVVPAHARLRLDPANPVARLTITDGAGKSTQALLHWTVNATKDDQPLILSASPCLLALGATQELTVQGDHLDQVTQMELVSDQGAVMPAQVLRVVPFSNAGLSARVTQQATIRLSPTAAGLARLRVPGGLLQGPRLMVADVGSTAKRDAILAGMTDVNYDGFVNADDLADDTELLGRLLAGLSGNGGGLDLGLPDMTAGGTDPLGSTQGSARALLLSKEEAPLFSQARTACHDGGVPEGFPLVVMEPLPRTALAGGTQRILDAQGSVLRFLVPHDTVAVRVVLIANGQELGTTIPALTPSGTWTNDHVAPLEATVAHLPMDLVPKQTKTVRIRMDVDRPQVDDATPATFSRTTEYTIDRDAPQVDFAFLDNSTTQADLLGYQSLYNSLTIDSTSYVQPNYQFTVRFSDDLGVDLKSLEVRLDNRTEPLAEFLQQPAATALTGSAQAVTLSLKGDTVISIANRWADSTAAQKFFSLPQLVYGVHTVQVSAKDLTGKTGVAVRYFQFRAGDPVAVTTTVTTAFELQSPERWTSALRNTWGSVLSGQSTPSSNPGLYRLVNGADLNTALPIALFPSPGDLPSLRLLLGGETTGDVAPPDGNGLVAMSLNWRPRVRGWEDDVTRTGGAIEQLWRRRTAEGAMSLLAIKPSASPINEPVDATNGNQLTTTTTTYTLNTNFPTKQVPIKDLFDAQQDRFRTDVIGDGNQPTNLAVSLANRVWDTKTVKTTTTTIIPPPTGDSGNVATGGGSGTGSGFGSSGGSSGLTGSSGGGTGDGPSSPTPPQITGGGLGYGPPGQPPGDSGSGFSPKVVRGAVHDPVSFTLTVKDRWDTDNAQENGRSVYTNGALSAYAQEASGTAFGSQPVANTTNVATLNPLMPLIEGAVSGLTPDASGHYFAGLQWVQNVRYYVDGFALGGSRTALKKWAPEEAEHYFLPQSDPRPICLVLESTLRVEPALGNEDPTLSLSVLVQDPLTENAALTVALPTRVTFDSQETLAMTADQGAHTGVMSAAFSGIPLLQGVNTYPIRVMNAVGQVTRAMFTIDIGDGDNDPTTTDDWFVLRASLDTDFQQTDVPLGTYTLGVFAELPEATGSIRITGVPQSGATSTVAGDLQGDFALARAYGTPSGDARFGRFQRPLLVMSDQPPEGAIRIPKDPTAVRALPLVFGNPGDALDLTYGKQSAKLYVEGVAMVQQQVATNRLRSGRSRGASTSEGLVHFTVAGRRGRLIDATTEFHVAVLDAQGAQVALDDGQGGSLTSLDLPVKQTKDGFDSFGIIGESDDIRLVDDTPTGSRLTKDDQGRQLLRVAPNECLIVTLDAPWRPESGSQLGTPGSSTHPSPLQTERFRSRALIEPAPPQLRDEALTGVTPIVGRSLPLPWQHADVGVTMHTRFLRYTQTLCSLPGFGQTFAPSLTYRSGHIGSGTFGRGWTASWESRLQLMPPGYATRSISDDVRVGPTDPTALVWFGADGREDCFPSAGKAGQWRIPPGLAVAIEAKRAPDRNGVPGAITEILITETDGSRTSFEPTGTPLAYRLAEECDRFGNRITYQYLADGSLASITDDRGVTYQIRLASQSVGGVRRVEQMVDPRGLTYHFDYNDLGRLSEVRITSESSSGGNDVVQQAVDFRYDTTGQRELAGILLPTASGSADSQPYATITYDTDAASVQKVAYGIGGVITERFADGQSTDADGVVTAYQFKPGNVDVMKDASMVCNVRTVDPTTLKLTTWYRIYGDQRVYEIHGPTGIVTALEYTAATPTISDRRGVDLVTKRTVTPHAVSSLAKAAGIDNKQDPLVDSWAFGTTANGFSPLSTTERGVTTTFTPLPSVQATVDGHGTSATYDVTATHADGTTTVTRLNSYGQVIQERDADGSLTEHRYAPPVADLRQDSLAQRLQGYPIGTAQSLDAQPLGTDLSTVDAKRVIVTTQSPNAFGQVVSTTSPRGATSFVTIATGDRLGRVIAQSGPPIAGTSEDGKLSVSGETRTVEEYLEQNGRGVPKSVRRKVPVLSPGAPQVSHDGQGTLVGSVGYQYLIDRTDYEPDGLDRPTKITHSVQGDNGYEERNYGSGERLQWSRQIDGSYAITKYDTVGRPTHQYVGCDDALDTIVAGKDQRLVRVSYTKAGDVQNRWVTYGGRSGEILEEQRSYDGFDRLVAVIEVVTGRTTKRVYDVQGRLAVEEVVDGTAQPITQVQHEYDTMGRPWVTTNLLTGAVTTQVTDAAQATTTTTNPVGYQTITRQDGAGRPVESTMGITGSLLASAAGYDADGNLVTRSVGRTVAVARSHWSPSADLGVGAGKAPFTVHNRAGAPIRIRQPELDVIAGAKAVQDLIPSGFGTPSAEVDGRGNFRLRTFTEDGRVRRDEQITVDNSSRVSHTFAIRPHRTVITAQLGANRVRNQAVDPGPTHVTMVDADRLGRTISQVDWADTTTTSWQSQPMLGLESSLRASLSTTATDIRRVTTAYDDLGRPSRTTREDGSQVVITYYPDNDANKNNRRQVATIGIQAVGSQTVQVYRRLKDYDRFGQPTTLVEIQPDGTQVELVQERGTTGGQPGFGQLVRESTRLLDAQGQNPSLSRAVSYSYDLAGKRLTLSVPSGTVTSYQYVDGQTLTGATRTGGGLTDTTTLFSSTLDPDYHLASTEARWNGAVTLTRSFAGREHVGTPDTITSGSQVMLSQRFDERNMPTHQGIWSAVDSQPTRQLLYTDLGHLTDLVPRNGDLFSTEQFTLDAFGNRSGPAKVDGIVMSFVKKGWNQVSSVTAETAQGFALTMPEDLTAPWFSSTTATVTYGSRNQPTSDGSQNFIWDNEDRLITSTVANYQAYNVIYAYDSLGRRAFRWEERPFNLARRHVRVALVHDGDRLIEEWANLDEGTGPTTLVRRTTWGPDGHAVAVESRTFVDSIRTVSPPLRDSFGQWTGELTPRVLETDEEGTVWGVVDGSGARLERLSYDATGIARTFGAADIQRRSSAYVPFAWKGQFLEPISNRLWNGQRDYDPLLGGQLTGDPGYSPGKSIVGNRSWLASGHSWGSGAWNSTGGGLIDGIANASDLAYNKVFNDVNYSPAQEAASARIMSHLRAGGDLNVQASILGGMALYGTAPGLVAGGSFDFANGLIEGDYERSGAGFGMAAMGFLGGMVKDVPTARQAPSAARQRAIAAWVRGGATSNTSWVDFMAAARERVNASYEARGGYQEGLVAMDQSAINGKSLLPGEGAVGTYDELISAGSKGDNITPHHIPSTKHMQQYGVSKGDGITINMEQPSTGGRHRATFTYGNQADALLRPRQALGLGVLDARRIYLQDGLYGPNIRNSLRELIRRNKEDNPGLFDK